ncbi:MAG: histidine kinase, partial [Clostridiales bacterium]|nr:histidine kinase [Clostridiales bacterium]
MIRKLFDDISIRNKFTWVYLFCVLLPAAVSGIVWAGFTSSETRQNTLNFLEKTLTSAASDFNLLAQSALNIANQVGADKRLIEDLKTPFSSPAEHYELYWNSLRSRFSVYMTSNSDIADVTLYIDDPHFINCDYFRVLDSEVKNTGWYQAASESTSNVVIYPYSTSISIRRNANRVTVIRKIRDPSYLDNATNYLLVEISLDHVVEKIGTDSEFVNAYLSDAGGRILWSAEGMHEDNGSPAFESPIGIAPWFNGWKITGIYDEKKIYMRQLTVLGYIMAITISMSLLSLALIRGLLNSLQRRIFALSKHMKHVGDGHFEPLGIEPGKVEVGFLINTYNDMVGEINDLINVVYKLEMQKKSAEVENMRAEYKYLQAQVDPHFLFNTLNAILVFCVKNKYTELADVISSLSKMLKRLLSRGADKITLDEEFQFIEKYLAIEKFRFGEQFNYTIEIGKEIAKSGRTIPKMSIQPLVENACKHGLQSISGARWLSLCASMDESQTVTIILTDNGAGMDAETVSNLMKSLESDQPAPPSPQYNAFGQAG